MADVFQRALAQLQQVPEGGTCSVYEHLAGICLHLLETKPESVDLFDISVLIARTAVSNIESDPLVPYRPEPEDASRTQAALDIFGDPEQAIDPEMGIPVKTHAPNVYESEDTTRAAQLFEAVGIALTAEEMYGVGMHIKKLGEAPTLKIRSIRFFGKFFGLYADYYVFETSPSTLVVPIAETPEDKASREAAREYPAEQGSGANQFQYYVCNELGGPTTKLQDVRPEHIRAARTLKRYLTGRLENSVSAYPSFPGDEGAFLRAQIARISATTVLAPSDWFTAEEGDDGQQVVAKAEEIAPVALPDPGAIDEWLSNWVHRQHHLKRQGRCETKPVRELPEDSEEEIELTEDETEEGPAGGNVLGSVADDARVDGCLAWAPVFSSSSRFAKGQVSGLRSVLWPGAAVVTHGQDFFNVYVGWGLKNVPFVPRPPPPVAEEYSQSQMASIDLPQKPDPYATLSAELPAEE